MKYKSIKILLFIALIFGAERFCHFQTQGFRIQKILSDLPFDPRFQTTPLNEKELQAVVQSLQQPYYFLASGNECYAFESQDGKTVLKFFKHHHMRTHTWFNRFKWPFFIDPVRQKIIDERGKRLVRSFQSNKIAYEDLKEETGLIYAHLNKTASLFKTPITLYDNLGIAHLVDIDQVEFMLQKKAELVSAKFHHLLRVKDLTETKRCIDSLVSLIFHRAQKGIHDRDPVLARNYGYVNDQAVIIDLGSFSKNPFFKRGSNYKKELFYETLELRCLIEKSCPELSSYLDKRIEEVLHEG